MERMCIHMIQVDISNIWGQLCLPDLLAMEKEVSQAFDQLLEGSGPGGEFVEWQNLPVRESEKEIARIEKAAQKIRKESDVCVVVSVGGAALGARAAMELLQGAHRNLTRKQGDPQIIFAGNSFSTRRWNELMKLLEDKDFSLVAISKSGTATESGIAFRGLRWMLERKYGTDEANRRIYVVTDPCKGALHQMAAEEGWETFAIPAGVTGRYSVLSAAGLLPMAVAGMDISEVLKGAAEVKEECGEHSLENPVWQYAAVRNMMLRSGKAVELLVSFEPDFAAFGDWWQKLFAESEGKAGKGLFPASSQFSTGLHSLGQLIQEGQRNLFETLVSFDGPQQKYTVGSDWKNLDNLNYLEGKTLDEVQRQAFDGTLNAHVDGGVPVITVDCGELNEAAVGGLFYFFEMSCALSAYILGVNPFNQPGVELYKRNMFQLLGKPGYDF